MLTRWIKEPSLPFASHEALMDFGCLCRGTQIPTLISIRALSVVVQAGLKNQFLIPALARMLLFPEHHHWQLLGEGGRENWAVFQKNKYSLFVFVFASMLNSDCILCLDTTIIINFPMCSSILAATKTRWWVMLDVVTGWVGGRGRQMFSFWDFESQRPSGGLKPSCIWN